MWMPMPNEWTFSAVGILSAEKSTIEMLNLNYAFFQKSKGIENSQKCYQSSFRGKKDELISNWLPFR